MTSLRRAFENHVDIEAIPSNSPPTRFVTITNARDADCLAS